jgi:3'-phosphoadenosine 5'-phosphosulfate synthase
LSEKLKLLPFKFASYDKTKGAMDFFDPARKDDFESISGSKMRKMAREGATPPAGFMDPDGWDVVVKYYQSLAEQESRAGQPTMSAATSRSGQVTMSAAPAEKIALADVKELYAKDAESTRKEAAGMESVTLNSEDLEWVHVLAEGWATPLNGFMTEQEYLSCLHYQMITKDDGAVVPMPVPIVLPVTDDVKNSIEGKSAIALKNAEGKVVAVLRDPEIYPHRKEERATRTFGINADRGHPYVEKIFDSGEWLVGGKIEVLDRVKYNDGMDQWRLSPLELQEKFKELDADAVFVFQLRNPVHNGHALLMQDTARRLKEQGYKKPVLWLSPLGGWTKDDDVPLDTRMEQHNAIIKNKVFGETEVVLAIFPSPMIYGGPREVQWHATSRMYGGASHYIVGRDPAGMKHPTENELQPSLGDDMYDQWHGQTMLQLNPVLSEKLKLLPFKFASYDKTKGAMDFFDPARKDDFESISGSKMRKMAREGATPPAGFMDPDGWDVVVKYYQSLAEA